MINRSVMDQTNQENNQIASRISFSDGEEIENDGDGRVFSKVQDWPSLPG